MIMRASGPKGRDLLTAIADGAEGEPRRLKLDDPMTTQGIIDGVDHTAQISRLSPLFDFAGDLTGTDNSGGVQGGGAITGTDNSGAADGTDPNTHELPGFPAHDQNAGPGGERACGTTALWSILDYFNPGAPGNDRFSIDHAIRRGNVGASADDLVSYAESQGYRAAIKDDASLDDIKRMIDQGVPVMCNIDPDGGGNFNLHWIDVVGYTTDDKGDITSLKVMNPSGGQISDMDVNTFMQQWSDIHEGNMHTGVNRQILTFVPNDDRMITGLDGVKRRASDIDLPSDGWLGNVFNDSQPARVIDDGKSDLFNGWERLKSGDVGGLFQLGGSVEKFIMGGVGFALTNFIGYPLESAGKGAVDWANDQWSNGGLLGKIGAIGGWIGGGLLQGIGWGVSKIGDGISWLGGQIGDVSNAIGNGVSAAASAVGNAVSDAANAVGNAVQGAVNFFKGLF
jgi:hypothetical protein